MENPQKKWEIGLTPVAALAAVRRSHIGTQLLEGGRADAGDPREFIDRPIGPPGLDLLRQRRTNARQA